ncbi:MAG TPA: peptidoglycan-binding protein [bacterium]|nr:peptidoglycan-binding protein [bacterium]
MVLKIKNKTNLFLLFFVLVFFVVLFGGGRFSKAMSDGSYFLDGTFSTTSGVSTDGQFMVVPFQANLWVSSDLTGCDINHLNLCLTEIDCTAVGAYWYNNQCNANRRGNSTYFFPVSPVVYDNAFYFSAGGKALSGMGTIINPYSTNFTVVDFSFDSDAMFVALSERADFSGSIWQPILNTKKVTWQFSSPAVRVLYVKFRTILGGESGVYKFYFNLNFSQNDIVVENNNNQTTNPLTVDLISKYLFSKFLSIGSNGEEVRQLQLKLKELGYYTYSSITGYYGSFTAEAVKKFQAARGISPVGYVGPATRAALNGEQSSLTISNSAGASYLFKNFLSLGSSGEETRQLQLKLKELGYFTYSSITGYYGSFTAEAVKKFQAAQGISPVGYVGPATRAALNSK